MFKSKVITITLYLVLAIIMCTCLYRSLEHARQPWEPDISALYCAAHVILNPALPNNAVYDTKIMQATGDQLNVGKPADFIYSVAAAYFFIPLTLIPYETAKIFWNLCSFFLYLAGGYIVLRLNHTKGLFLFLIITMSVVFLPFMVNQMFIQINTLLLLLVALAVLSAVRGFLIPCGFLLAVAALFKMYPALIALAMGLKNWRITAVFLFICSIFLLIPGSLEWFTAVKVIFPHYTHVFLWINNYGTVWFIAYVILVALFTVFIIRQAHAADYPGIVSITIPAIFLVLPIVEFHHLTLLWFSYAYLLSKPCEFSRGWLPMALISFASLSQLTELRLTIFQTGGIMMLWSTLAFSISNKTKYDKVMVNYYTC